MLQELSSQHSESRAARTMSNRDKLRKLSSQIPAKTAIEEILGRLRKESDFAAAITGAAILEAWLENTIISKIQNPNADNLARIFKNRGPLSDFSSKILIAEAFGIITGPMASDFHCIRAIRNAFAHSKVILSFDTPEVVDEVCAFKMTNALLARHEGNDAAFSKMTHRQTYELIVRIMLIILEEIETSGLLANEVMKRALSVTQLKMAAKSHGKKK